MKAHLELGGRQLAADLGAGIGLSIPIRPDGRHPRFFVDEAVGFETLSGGGFTGRVERGGSCNVDRVRLIPHCHGTHTEGPGHITRQAEPVQQGLETGLIPAWLLSVNPGPAAGETAAGIGPVIRGADLSWPAYARALIIRTLPNDPTKCERDYASAAPYPLLSVEAMRAIANGGIEHLLIDTPSVDAADDGGQLAQHRRFWQMAPGQTEAPARRGHCSITELIYVPEQAADGAYLLSLGVSALHGDASPSAPLIFPLR